MIRFATESEAPVLKKIWQACFDDPQEYIDTHYANHKYCARTIVLCENDKIVSMFDMIDIQIRSCGQVHKCFYIYAAATLPEYQGKGYMHRLIDHACDMAKDEGMAAAVLIPQSKSLVEFYQKQGFNNHISYDIIEFQRKSAASIISPLSESEFIEVKNKYENSLADCVLHSSNLSSLIYKQTKTLTGLPVKIQTFGNESYAICYKEKRRLFIQEISSADEYLEGDISALCDYFDVKKAKVIRMGEKYLYGLARQLNSQIIKWDKLYMNTMLD